MKAKYLMLGFLTAVAGFLATQANAHLYQDSYLQYYQNGTPVGYMYQSCSGATKSAGIVTDDYEERNTPCGDPNGGDYYDFYCDDVSMTCYYD
jgi:hypothetical protein